MDVIEVTGLADWIGQWVLPTMAPYEQLVVALEQNANNTSKVPLRDLMEELRIWLNAMPVEHLTKQQADLLGKIGIYELLGKPGWRFIEKTVKEGNYDPATTAQDSRRAKQELDKLIVLFERVRASLKDVMIEGEPISQSSEKLVIFRVQFAGDASIKDVADFKESAAEWYDIARGITLAVSAKPEDVEIIGASTGSIIVTLRTALAVAMLLALIMKEAAEIVKTGYEIAKLIEEWSPRQILNKDLEEGIKSRQRELHEHGPQEILKKIKEMPPYGGMSSENEAILKKSIQKFIEFSRRGGDVDMIPPPAPMTPDDADKATTEELRSTINEITEQVRQTRLIKSDTQRLIESSKTDGDIG
ncbi:MAG: hypothetical protein ING09_05050 [Roseomonas sp.]|jgi:hypothetical protein|nr:hypothetical protein [Roseomonas sp.]MCA3290516.1 hypothetical protein [Roseomonas sp.]MCA3293781.1 hypothetical protein [Roseomonas sp.]MCA3300291.1 hypothetical protein [Roseomonas sp.]